MDFSTCLDPFIDQCNATAVRNPLYAGHSWTCIDNPDCPSSLRCFRELSCHFSAVRTIVHTLYDLEAMADGIGQLEMALCRQGISEIITATEKVKSLFYKNNSSSDSSEENIIRAASVTIKEDELLQT